MGKTPLQNSSKKKIVFRFCFLVFMLFGLCATTNADNCLPLYREGRYTEAIQCYDEVIRENISSNVVGSAWFQKGICLSNLGNIDEAVAAMDEAAKVDPQYTGFSSALYPDYKRISESTEMNTMVEDSNDAASWNDKGNVLAMQGKYDEAIKAFNEAIQLDPNNSATWSNKGNVLSLQGNYNESIKAFDEAIKLDPNNAGAWNNKGMDLYDQGKYDEAIKAFDEAIRLKPDYARARQNKDDANSALAQQKNAEAIMEKSNGTEAVKEKLGPYTVSFILTNTSLEVNSSASKWGNPFSDDSGYSEGTVHVVPKNRTNLSVAMITVMESNSGMEYDTSGGSPARNLEKGGWENIQVSTRIIDGDKTATFVSADSPTLRDNSIYWITYRLNNNAIVDIQSWIPMDKGTEDLLNTIHVAWAAI
jgi:Flp pilus assembly protein TadD